MHSHPVMRALFIGGGWTVEDLKKLEAQNPKALIPDEYEYVDTRIPNPGDYYMHSTKDNDPGFPIDAFYCAGVYQADGKIRMISVITTPRLIVKKS